MFKIKDQNRRRGGWQQRHNITAYVTRQYMKQNRRRTLTAYFGIVCMVLLLTCVFIGKDTCIQYLEELGTLKLGRWHACVYDVTQEEEQDIQELPYIKQTAVSVDCGMALFPASASADCPYLHVKSYETDCFAWMNIKLKEGRLPKTDEEIVLSERALADGAGLSIGDQINAEFIHRSIIGTDPEVKSTVFPFFDIKVSYGQEVDIPADFPYFANVKNFREKTVPTGIRKNYKITGIIKQPYFENTGDAGYMAITALTAPAKEKLSHYNLALLLDTDTTPYTWIQDIHEKVPKDREIDLNNYVMIFTGHSAKSTLNYILAFMMTFFISLIMLASIFLIYNIFNMSYEERSQYLGMLASVGATGRQKRSSVYYEVFHLMILAFPAGVLLGILTVKLGITALSPFFGKFMGLEAYVKDLPARVDVSIPMLGAVLLVSMITIFISAYLPAARLSKIGPIAGIRGEEPKKKQRYNHTASYTSHFSRIKIRYPGILGIERMLAKTVLRRQRKKTRAITMSAAIFVTILAVTGFAVSQLKSIIQIAVRNDVDIQTKRQDWDYVFMPDQCSIKEFEAFQRDIADDPGVEKTRVWGTGMFAAQIPAGTLSQEYWAAYEDILSQYYGKVPDMKTYYHDMPLNVLAVDDQTMEELAKITGARRKGLMDPEHPGAIVVQKGILSTDNISVQGMEASNYRAFEISHMTDMKAGDTIQAEVYSEKDKKSVDYPITIEGLASEEQLKDYASFGGEFFWIIVNWDNAMKLQQAMAGKKRFISIMPEIYIKMNGTETNLADRLEKICENGTYAFVPYDYEADFFDAVIGIINIMMGCFVALTSVICLLNLANAVRGRFISRRQEFAMLESMGMTGGQRRRMLRHECLAIVCRSLLLAAVISLPMLYMIRRVLVSVFGYYMLNLPTGIFITAVLADTMAVYLLTRYFNMKEKTVNILEYIRRESV